jgi:hypothetical protein
MIIKILETHSNVSFYQNFQGAIHQLCAYGLQNNDSPSTFSGTIHEYKHMALNLKQVINDSQILAELNDIFRKILR